jgi:hypothetical protein
MAPTHRSSTPANPTLRSLVSRHQAHLPWDTDSAGFSAVIDAYQVVEKPFGDPVGIPSIFQDALRIREGEDGKAMRPVQVPESQIATSMVRIPSTSLSARIPLIATSSPVRSGSLSHPFQERGVTGVELRPEVRGVSLGGPGEDALVLRAHVFLMPWAQGQGEPPAAQPGVFEGVGGSSPVTAIRSRGNARGRPARPGSRRLGSAPPRRGPGPGRCPGRCTACPPSGSRRPPPRS